MKTVRKSAKSTEFTQFVSEQMALFGPTITKAMFGGFGIYRDDLVFAIIVDDKLYFKVDADSVEEFKRLGQLPFTYEARGKRIAMSYYEAPAEVFEDRQEMANWAKKAYQSALKAKKPKARQRD
ncbi:MAG TPA: TfoX/Sxy family protein [Methylophilaceae bacterium]|jgi:DNA transformation protein